MADQITIASDLQFPEGPIACSDGSILLVEIKRGTLTWLTAEGDVRRRYEVGGGPNGAAIGPDGAVYVCNNGGCFEWVEVMGMTLPGHRPDTYSGGRIQRVDLDSGEVTVLYTEGESDHGPVALRAPNDLVFDSAGGFWFTDHGTRTHDTADRTGIYYAKADGSSCRQVLAPIDGPNGIGLSPDGTRLYAAETHTGRLWQWQLSGPGQIDPAGINPLGSAGATLLHGAPGHQLFDSLAVDGEGWVCVATIINGGVTAVSPDGATVEHTPFADVLTTNICFGGDDLRTAYVTLSATGHLVKTEWPRPGLQLAYSR